MAETAVPALTVTFAGRDPVLLDCGATSLSALKRLGLDPGEIAAVFVSHLHGDHFGGLPFLILDGQFSRRTKPLIVAGPPGLAHRLTEAGADLLISRRTRHHLVRHGKLPRNLAEDLAVRDEEPAVLAGRPAPPGLGQPF